LGNPPNYVEPFLGSAAVLLARPDPGWRGALETVNDANGYVCNLWRALQADPDQVAHYADWPALENDLHARHWWLINRREHLRSRREGDPDFYDAKAAGWSALRWKATGGYGGQRKASMNTNKHREVVWFSPHCLRSSAEELPLFEALGAGS